MYCLSCVSRPAHDISLEEFDDEDLSEITDDCGIGLNYDSDPYEKVGPSVVDMLFLLNYLPLHHLCFVSCSKGKLTVGIANRLHACKAVVHVYCESCFTVCSIV